MAKYVEHVVNPATSQSEKAKEGQVKNKAGGYVFKVDAWTRLNRFLILGNEGGTYYASERSMTMENYQVILDCLKLDKFRTVDDIVDISYQGRAVKNEPAIFALAVCSVHGDDDTRAYANQMVPSVARFSTALFGWIDAVVKLKQGRKGKGLARAIGRWYSGKTAKEIAYQVCKYSGRRVNGGQKWTHKDALRIARMGHPRAKGKVARNGKALTIPSKDHATVIHYATHGVTTPAAIKQRELEAKETGKTQEAPGLSSQKFTALKNGDLSYIWGHEMCRRQTSVKEVVKLVNDFGLTRESVPQELRNDIEVQKALLPRMPMTALIRNLGSMTSSGLLKSLSDEVIFVAEKIVKEDLLKKARIHPMAIMLALRTYASGAGMRTTWKPVATIKDALEDAFYKSFNYVEPTGKKFMYGIDVSSSMGWDNCSNTNIKSREAAAIMAMICARTEPNYEIMAFADEFRDLNITAKDSLDTVIRRTSSLIFGRTDCALPMKYAIKHGLDVDVFVVLTDNETWFGGMHPFEALKKYRAKFNEHAKLVVMAFTATGHSIADPSDSGMLDIAGLDANVPKILSEFASQRL